MSTILIVEDNEMNRDMLSRAVQKAGHDVVIACDGRDALTATESSRPDLILMDLSLPEIDGWGVARRLRAQESTRHIPIIAVTAHALAEEQEEAMRAGCDHVETKPLDLPRLLDAVQRLLAGRPHE